MKIKIYMSVIPLMSAFLSGFVVPQASFPIMPSDNNSSNSQSPQSQHDKLSRVAADRFIKAGVTNSIDISMQYGMPNIAMKNSDGNAVWMFQAKSVIFGVRMDHGSNTNIGFGASSLASSMRSNTEVSSKSTILTITFDSNGIVESYDSQTTLN